MPKDINQKNWGLPVQWNGNRYSEASDVPVIAAPTSFTATPSTGAVGLAWANNATGSYETRIERSPNGSTGWTTIATKSAGVTSHTDNGLLIGTYYYRACASISGTDSNYATANATVSSGPTAIANDNFDSATTGQPITSRTAGQITWQTPSANVVLVSDTFSTSPSKSLRFSFNPNVTAEQRYTLTNPQREITIHYKWRVPSNHSHAANNNKFAALWMDDYSAGGDGPTIIWEFWPDGANGSRLAVHYSEGNYNGAGTHLQETSFVTVPADRGVWYDVVLYVKAATSRVTPINTGSNPYKTGDGIISTHIKKAGASWQQLHNVTTANIASPSGGPDGFKYGYLMGYANGTYPAQTLFYVDDITVYDGDARAYIGV